MYINIDMQRLLILHKHSSHAVIANLAHIEGVSVVMRTTVGDDPCAFHDLTCTDISMLYHNTTGERLNSIYRESVIKAMLGVIDRMPETDVDPAEVSAQAFAVPWTTTEHFRYVKGAMKPTVPQGLFMPEGIKVDPLPIDREVAAVRVATPVPPPYVPPPPPPPKTPAPPRAPRAPREPGASSPIPGEGTLTSRIYARCKAELDATGGTADAVRLSMAKKLIEEGVNASTARRQTMEWMRSL